MSAAPDPTSSRRWTPTPASSPPSPRDLTPHVAALQVTGPRRPRRRGLGRRRSPTTGCCSPTRTSWPRATRGRAVFSDGTRGRRRRRRRRPAVRPRGGPRPDATPAAGRPRRRRRRCGSGQLVVAVGNPLGPGRLGHRRGGQRAGPLAAHPRRPDGAGGRGRHPDRRRAQPRATPAARSPTPRPAWSASTPPSPAGVSASPCPINDTSRRIIGALVERRPGAPGLPRAGQHARAAAGAARRADRPAARAADRRRRPRRARPTGRG